MAGRLDTNLNRVLREEAELSLCSVCKSLPHHLEVPKMTARPRNYFKVKHFSEKQKVETLP